MASVPKGGAEGGAMLRERAGKGSVCVCMCVYKGNYELHKYK